MRMNALVCGLTIAGSVPTCAWQAAPEARTALEAKESAKITFEEGLLTAKVSGRTLGRVTEQLSAVTHVDIVVAKELNNTVVSFSVTGVALDTALRDMFSSYDAFFFYSASKAAPATLRSIWIYPKGVASALKPVRPEEWASSKELVLTLQDSDPEARALAYEALVDRPDRRNLVLDALTGTRERDPVVRERLLAAALGKGFAVPAEVLVQLARADSSEQIRWMALDALAEQPSAKQVAEAAMADPSESVRTRAKEVLMQLSRQEGRTNPADETPPVAQPE